MTYGQIIKKHRIAQEIPQRELTRLSKISQGNISKIENGRLSIKAEDLFAIARVLKIKCKELERVTYE